MSARVSPTPAERAVIWHDAECGGYRADLALWRRLANEAGGLVLDVGAGTGRVALDLAAAGYGVTALDIDAVLIDALREQADQSGLAIDTVVADVRALEPGPRFALVIAPMQVLQLLLTPDERRLALRAIRESLLPGGSAAFALVEDAPEAEENGMPLPDVRDVDGWIYSSQPVWVGRDGEVIIVRRLRQWVSPEGELSDEDDEAQLALLTAAELEAEAADCGFRPVARHVIEPTDDHVGSTVVELEAT